MAFIQCVKNGFAFYPEKIVKLSVVLLFLFEILNSQEACTTVLEKHINFH